jgi:hypothetical protein
MKIYVENEEGKMYEATQINENTFELIIENKTFTLNLTESENTNDLKKLTRAIFSNEAILEQLNDARKSRGSNNRYYSGDEREFDKLVDEIENDK